MDKIKILIVDDSLLFRNILAKGLSEDPDIEVVATAIDPFDARDKILEYHPDVMTLDIEMPKMNGIDFLKRLLPQYPLPTIVISAIGESMFEAMQLGVVDFMRKPDGKMFIANKDFFRELILKVKMANKANVQSLINKQDHSALITSSQMKDKIVAIGASTGGTVALTQVISALKPPFPGIVIVQHIPPIFSDMFAKRLDSISPFKVKEAVDGDIVKQDQILIAPGNLHMKVKRMGSEVKVECFEGAKVNGHCPSVDVLFNSVALLGRNAIGVIMTGMGYDGAKGLLKMRLAGARTLGQDEKSSVVYGMPKVAYNIGAVESEVPLDRIAAKICSLL